MSEILPLERIWEYREETIYPKLFGTHRRGTFVLSFELFRNVFSQEAVDPRWLHYGVIEFGPISDRDSWIYVTTAASNPWELDPDQYAASEYSGFGTELVLELDRQADWPILILQRLLAFNILLAHGRFGDKPMLNYGDRVPLRAPIDINGNSVLRNVVATKPLHYDSWFQLESGRVDLIHFVGISDREAEYARSGDTSDELVERLERAGFWPVTNPDRNELADV